MLSGRQLEIEARRERFLEVALEILLQEGYEAVTIARIAEATGFSKGTVYQFFSSKEELVTTLGLISRARLVESVEHGATFKGRTREKVLAIGISVAHHDRAYPHDQRLLKMIDAEALLDRVDVEGRKKMEELDVRMFQALLTIAEEAIAAGDLALTPPHTPHGLCFAFWAMVDGAQAASFGGAPLESIGIPDPLEEVMRSGHCMLDGYGWRPLSSEWDYEETIRRVQRELFEETTLPGRSAS
jgi:AcrR family transcriptional regulator